MKLKSVLFFYPDASSLSLPSFGATVLQARCHRLTVFTLCSQSVAPVNYFSDLIPTPLLPTPFSLLVLLPSWFMQNPQISSLRSDPYYPWSPEVLSAKNLFPDSRISRTFHCLALTPSPSHFLLWPAEFLPQAISSLSLNQLGWPFRDWSLVKDESLVRRAIGLANSLAISNGILASYQGSF